MLRTDSSSVVISALVALALALFIAVGDSARRAYGMPFPSVLVTADGRFAEVFLPEWGVARAPIEHGDPVVAIDGVPVNRSGAELPGRAVYRLVAARHGAGARSVTIAYVQRGVRRTLTLPLRTVGVRELWFFTILIPLAGAVYLASGLLVLRLGGGRSASRAYLLGCCAMFVTLSASFDYLTTSRLQPLFPVGLFSFSLAFAWTAYAFPAPPTSSTARRSARALTGAFLVIAGWVAVEAMGADQRALHRVTDVAGLVSVAALGVTFSLRFGLTAHPSRAPIFAIAWILGIVPIFWGSLLFGLARGEDGLHLLGPFVFLAIPLAVDYAHLRQSALHTQGVLVQRMLIVPALLWALLVGGTIAWGLYAVALSPRAVIVVPAVAATTVAAVMFAFAPRIFKGLYFSATAWFRPTVEHLSDALATLTDRAAVCDALEGHVTRLMSAPGVRVLTAGALDDLAPTARDELAAGRHLLRWGADERGLLIPMRCRGELQGALRVPERPDASRYNHDDLALLDTIASLGALALRHADAVGELDALRRAEVEATREDRDLALGLLSAEVCHEVAYSLNYFRFLLRRASAGNAPGAKDIELGNEEINRLERMLSSLRRVDVAQPEREAVRLLDPVERALGLLRDEARERQVTVDVPGDLVVTADRDALVQVFANLLRNALHAADGGSVGVRAASDAGALTVDVWDTGPGVPAELTERIFTPWVTTKKQGLGLGLAITERLARSMGFAITLHREGATTVFRLQAPSGACDDARETEAEGRGEHSRPR